MSDPVEILSKAVRAVRYAERGDAVGPKVSEEDHLIAADQVDALRAAGWRLVRSDVCTDPARHDSYNSSPDSCTCRFTRITEEWTG